MVTVMARRRLVHAAAWASATGAAVTLSWFGVHTVLSGTEYDPPRTLPIADESAEAAGPAGPSPQQPEPSPTRSSKPDDKPSSPGGSQPKPDGGAKTTKPPEQPSDSDEQPAPDSGGQVKGATVAGGRAVFDMREDYATLVSATPNDGWDTQVWKDSTWIRVTFTNHADGRSSSVFCRWDAGPPRIEAYDN